MHWILVTPAFPPADAGGIGGYTARLAEGLRAAGDRATIMAGPGPAVPDPNVLRLADHFGPAGRRQLSAFLATISGPRRMLIQYAPQPLGPRAGSRFKGLPYAFTRELGALQQRIPIWTMIHEDLAKPAGSGRASLKRRLLAPVTGRMLRQAVQAASHVFLSTEAWEASVLPRIKPGTPVETLPVPSNIATSVDPARVRALEARLGPGPRIGHFGTYSGEITSLLRPALERLLTADPARKAVLVGEGSVEFARSMGAFGRQLVAAGRLPDLAAAEMLSACHLMLQPFPDGISARRGSVMAGLALGIPVVTNPGEVTEALWRDHPGAIALADDLASTCEDLFSDPARRQTIGLRGRSLYQEQFSLDHTVRILRSRAGLPSVSLVATM
jgi:glycosyltransferase involved in cell wall biosynthesis